MNLNKFVVTAAICSVSVLTIKKIKDVKNRNEAERKLVQFALHEDLRRIQHARDLVIQRIHDGKYTHWSQPINDFKFETIIADEF